MTTLTFGSITIIVHGYTLNNGLPYFQKAVPRHLRARVGKSTIKIPLKAENGNVAVQCHRLDKKYTALFRALDEDQTLVPSEAKLAAIALLETYGLKQGDGQFKVEMPNGWQGSFDDTPHLNEYLDNLTGAPVEAIAKAALNNKLPVLLSEAFTVYLDNHKRGNDKDFQRAQRQHWDKLVGHLGDVALESVTRDQAKAFRDARLATGVKTTTLHREINVIRAVINVAINEVPLTIKNQFESLVIKGINDDKTDRIPYTRAEVVRLVRAAQAKDDDKRRIVLMLAVTGARLAEIVGLRKQDVDLKAGCIHIKAYDGRTVKTDASNRTLPLLPVALEAAKLQMVATKSEYLFPAYARKDGTNANSASAALNKWARAIVPGKSMHCFRHTLRDQMRAVMCPETVSKELGGWSATNDVSVGYGQGYPLELKREWLEKAYSWLQD